MATSSNEKLSLFCLFLEILFGEIARLFLKIILRDLLLIFKQRRNPKILHNISAITAVGMGDKDNGYLILEIKGSS